MIILSKICVTLENTIEKKSSPKTKSIDNGRKCAIVCRWTLIQFALNKCFEKK